MPTRYPTKTHFGIEKELADVCVCGHMRAGHDSSHEDSEGKESCYFCTCPEYKFEQKLTHEQIADLAMSIRMQNNKEKFTT